MSPVHGYLPLEIFSEILLCAIHASSDTGSRQPPQPDHDSTLRAAIRISSVCREWRRIVISLPALWPNIELINFLHPTPREAADCICDILQRTGGHFQSVSLDFTSLKNVANAETIIHRTLNNLMSTAILSPVCSWQVLCITAAEDEHIRAISDYLLFSTSASARLKLGCITTLQLVLTGPYRPPSHHSASTASQATSGRNGTRPWFSVLHFRSLVRLHLTNVDIFFPHILLSPLLSNQLLEIYLNNWTQPIESSFLLPVMTQALIALKEDHNLNELNYRLVINNPPLHSIGYTRQAFSYVSAVTVVFPDAALAPSLLVASMTRPPAASLTAMTPSPNLNVSETAILKLFRLFSFYNMTCLQLHNVTPQAWLIFLRHLKLDRTSMMLSVPNYNISIRRSLKHLIIRFAPPFPREQPLSQPMSRSLIKNNYIEHSSEALAVPAPGTPTGPMAGVGEEPESNLDFGKELARVGCDEDLEALMRKCLVGLEKNMVPSLKTIEAYDADGRYCRPPWNKT